MTDTASDVVDAEFEDAVNRVTIASWNRARSSDELQEFINRHHEILANAEV